MKYDAENPQLFSQCECPQIPILYLIAKKTQQNNNKTDHFDVLAPAVRYIQGSALNKRNGWE